MTAPADLRDRIARIVAPEAFAEFDRPASATAPPAGPDTIRTWRDHMRRLDAFAKADAIMALAPFAEGARTGAPAPRQAFLDLLAEAAAIGVSDIEVRACRGEAEVSIRGDRPSVRRELTETAAHDIMRVAFALAAPASDYEPDKHQGVRIDPMPGFDSRLRMARLQYDPLPDAGRRMTVRLVYRDGAKPPRRVRIVSGPAGGDMADAGPSAGLPPAGRAAERPYIIKSGDQGLENRVELVYGAPQRGGVVDLRNLAEGFGARRAASFDRMRKEEAFCAFVKRTAGSGLPDGSGDGRGERG